MGARHGQGCRGDEAVTALVAPALVLGGLWLWLAASGFAKPIRAVIAAEDARPDAALTQRVGEAFRTPMEMHVH